ncbi:MAG: HTH domain-containing protein [Terrisporobacter sp.]
MITLKDLAEKVLYETKKAMTAEEIWNYAVEKGYNKLQDWKGRTPWLTISAKIKADIRDNEITKFEKINSRPVKFIYKGIKIEEYNLSLEKNNNSNYQLYYKERDLHKFLTYYVFNYMGIYSKTVYHEKSKKRDKGNNEWLHPDMVGFYFPLNDWDKNVINLSNNIGSTPVKLYSFELKRKLEFSNIREAFFQAVSNSSWANEGYLVSPNICDDSDFIDELKRLSSSFGIGIIEIDIEYPDDSKIIFQAKNKSELDWETINKLISINEGFKEFISDINACITSNKIYTTAYDTVLELENLIV